MSVNEGECPRCHRTVKGSTMAIRAGVGCLVVTVGFYCIDCALVFTTVVYIDGTINVYDLQTLTVQDSDKKGDR